MQTSKHNPCSTLMQFLVVRNIRFPNLKLCITVYSCLSKWVSCIVENTIHELRHLDHSLIKVILRNYASTGTGMQTTDRNLLVNERSRKWNTLAACPQTIVPLSRALKKLWKLYFGKVMETEYTKLL